jgi:hypothetical protein
MEGRMAKQPNGNGTVGRDTTTVAVRRECHTRLVRLAALHNRSIGQLVDRLTGNMEAWWKARMTPEQWRRYVAEPSGISAAEARAIYQAAEHGDAPPTAPNGSSKDKEFVL